MLLTVIIPVYNCETAVEKLLEELNKQMTGEVEVLVVDDGSSDGSYGVCRRYAEKNENIRVLQQANGGCYVARQNAMNVATGEYITFIDSDDTVSTDYVKTIEDVITSNHDVDMFVFGYFQQYPKERRELRNERIMYDNTGDYFADVIRDKVHGDFALWSHVYKRAFLVGNGITFNTSYRKAGDAVFNDYCLMAEPKVLLCDEMVYTWNCGHESLTHKFESTMWKTLYEHNKNLEVLAAKFNMQMELQEELNAKRWYYFMYLFKNILGASNLDRIEKYENYKIILANNITEDAVDMKLKGIRRMLMRMAINHKNPSFLLLWYWTYFSTWYGFAARIYCAVFRRNRNS